MEVTLISKLKLQIPHLISCHMTFISFKVPLLMKTFLWSWHLHNLQGWGMEMPWIFCSLLPAHCPSTALEESHEHSLVSSLCWWKLSSLRYYWLKPCKWAFDRTQKPFQGWHTSKILFVQHWRIPSKRGLVGSGQEKEPQQGTLTLPLHQCCV